MPTTHTRPIRTLLATMLLVSGCVGQATAPTDPLPTAPPSSEPTATATPRLTARPSPTPELGCEAIVAAVPQLRPDPPLPPAPDPSIAGGDARIIAALDRGAARLGALQSYRFSVDTYGVGVIQLELATVDFALRGTINRSDGFAMDTLIGTRMREFDNEAAISSGGRWVVGADFVWGTDNLTDDLEPSRRGPGDKEAILALAPEGLASRLIVPFAAGYRRVGNERHGGVMTQHFEATPRGTTAYAEAFKFDGAMTADVWIALDGGHLAGARIAGTASHRNAAGEIVDDSVFVEFEITHPNGPANAVELPVRPVPDPVRPGAPVDLRLEYEVIPSDVRDPTAQDVDEVGATLRRRLGIWTRAIKVTVRHPYSIVVTVCGTTQPQEDRRLIISKGGVTVVALPATDYGTTTKPGPKALPAAGHVIDPGLTPVAPPARIGLGSPHVDPNTGQRGLAFRIANPSSDLFRAYAAEHPGEYVAVVLDTTVLVTLPIDDRLAKGVFMFTGDYTEAETRALLDYLYTDPLPFTLELIREVEMPASR